MTRIIECPNCNEEIEVNDLIIEENKDFYSDNCQNCGYEINIEIDRDIDGSISNVYAY